MSKTCIIGPTAFQIGEDPVDVSYGVAPGGMFAVIHVGPSLTLHVNGQTDPDVLLQLADCAAETADWLRIRLQQPGAVA